jgi:cytidylate kinase
MDHYVIAIDGVSGSGKSSTAKKAAEILNILYLDTGAMYRSLTYCCQKKKIPFSDESGVIGLGETLNYNFSEDGAIIVNDQDLSKVIREPQVSSQVSDYCAIPGVRKHIVAIQRKIGSIRSSVLEGRDIGTVVFPDTKFKFFFWASPEIRAQRRLKELQEKGISADFEEVKQNLLERDEKDSSRNHSPLIQAKDADFVDTSTMTFDDQVKIIVDKVTQTCT